GTRALSPDRLVHNLTVDGLHTYYVGVGATAVLTHNDDLLPLDQCFESATRVRDEGLARMHASLGSKNQVNRSASMIVGAVDRRTGDTAVGVKVPNDGEYCAEDRACEALMGKGSRREDIVYSAPRFPNDWKGVGSPLSRSPEVCVRCQGRIDPGQMPSDARAEPGGAWGW
ncbi:hypothetical protein ACFV4N_36985, partial [Actinosynnema sp. NPDC059797]